MAQKLGAVCVAQCTHALDQNCRKLQDPADLANATLGPVFYCYIGVQQTLMEDVHAAPLGPETHKHTTGTAGDLSCGMPHLPALQEHSRQVVSEMQEQPYTYQVQSELDLALVDITMVTKMQLV